MCVSSILNKHTYFNEVIIKHEHPDWGYGHRDIIHDKNQNDLSYDVNLYNTRKKINFGL
jgi:hypothetical protein